MNEREKERGAKSIKENEEYGRSTIEEDIYFRQRKLQEKQSLIKSTAKPIAAGRKKRIEVKFETFSEGRK